MRNLYLVLFVLWSLGSWYYYTCKIKNACWGDNSSTTTIPNTSTDQALLFRWSSFNIPLDSNFPSLKESILAAKEDGKVLEITGYQFPDEANYDTQYELGIARASEVKKLLVDYISEERIRIFSATLPTDEIPADSLIQGIQFEWVADETAIDEEEEEEPDNDVADTEEADTTPASTPTPDAPSSSSDVYSSNSFVKYFPYNKTAIPAELTTFLDDLAARLIAENEKVLIRGHTDSAGDRETNFKVGLRRAKKVRDQLKKRGVTHKQIKTTSDGEKHPIADNKTEEGRQLNRRIEIFIQ